jgi:hypothetical protein
VGRPRAVLHHERPWIGEQVPGTVRTQRFNLVNGENL